VRAEHTGHSIANHVRAVVVRAEDLDRGERTLPNPAL